jgi:hypothetical protein
MEAGSLSKFEDAGLWWNDKGIHCVTVDGSTYTLEGWTGHKYATCHKVGGRALSTETYALTPEYSADGGEIVGYTIQQNA